MKRINKIPVVVMLILFVGFSQTAFAQNEMTLDEVILKVKSDAYIVKAAENNKLQAEASLKLFKSQLKPNLGLDLLLPNFINTSSQVTQPDGSIVFQQVTQNNSSISLFGSQNISATGGQLFVQSDLQRFDNFTSDTKQYNGVPVRVGFVQPLFGYNSLKWDKKIMPLMKQEAEQEYNITVEDAKWRAANLYFAVLLAQVNEEIANTNMQVNEKLVEITKERYALGKTSRDELLQIEMSLKSASLSKRQAQNNVSLNRMSLFTFLGIDGDYPNQGKCVTPNPKRTIFLDVETLVSQANKNRPEIKRYERELLQGDQNIANVKSQYGISAEIFASFGFARGSENIDEVYTNPFDEQQVSFNVSMPLFDWGRKREAVKIATLQKENTLQKIEQESLELENNVRNSAAQFLQAQSDIEVLEDIKQVAEERFQISNERYKLGNISITDLILAQREKDQSLRAYIQALLNYWSTYYELRMLTGADI